MNQNPKPSQLEQKKREQLEHKQHKERVMPLIRYLRKNGLKFQHAVFMNHKIQYFRMDQFNILVSNKKQQINKNQILNNVVENVHNQLLFYNRPPKTEKYKYPQKLMLSKNGNGKFASFKFDTTESKKNLFYILLGIIIVCMLFPLWPYQAKYWLFLVSLTVFVALVILLLLRIVIYILLSTFGISFWLFPNLMGNYGVIDSFRPLYSTQKWQKDKYSNILRVIATLIFIYYCHSLYSQPDFYIENLQSAKQAIKDVHDWGVSKLKGQIGNFSERAITMDKIMNETADAFQKNQTDSQQVFKQNKTNQFNQGSINKLFQTVNNGSQETSQKDSL